MKITLSQRNLLTLLHKLHMEGSSRTLLKPTPNGCAYVSVESDEEAYHDREPGGAHPETEGFIARAEAWLRDQFPGAK